MTVPSDPTHNGRAGTPVAPARHAPLRVADVMSWSRLTFPEDLPQRVAALLLVYHDLGGAPVVDGDGELVGLVTDSDLLAEERTPWREAAQDIPQTHTHRHVAAVGDVCSRPAVTTSPTTELSTATRALLGADITRLVVVDGGEVVGVLSIRDALRGLARSTSAWQETVGGVTGARRLVEWAVEDSTPSKPLPVLLGYVHARA